MVDTISDNFTGQSAYPDQITTTAQECNDGTGFRHRANVFSKGIIDGGVEIASSIGYLVDAINNVPMLWGAGQMKNEPWGGFDHINGTISERLDQHICTSKHIDTFDEGLHIAGTITSYIAPAGAVAKLMSVKALAKSAGVIVGAEGTAFASEIGGIILFPDQIMEEQAQKPSKQNLYQMEF